MRASLDAVGRWTVAVLVASLLLTAVPTAAGEPSPEDVGETTCEEAPEVCSTGYQSVATVEAVPGTALDLFGNAYQPLGDQTSSQDAPEIQITCTTQGGAGRDADAHTLLDCTPVNQVVEILPDGDPGPCRKRGEDLFCNLGGSTGRTAQDTTVDRGSTTVADDVRPGARTTDASDSPSTHRTSETTSYAGAVAGPSVHREDAIVAAAATVAAGLAVLVLYRRLSRDEVLDNDLRASIVDLVAEHPGVHASELADELDIAVTTVLYHGRILAEADKLVVRRSDGRVRYLSGDEAASWRERELKLAMDGGTKSRLLRTLAKEPGLNMSDIGRRLEKARNTVKHHVDDLLERGLLVDRAEGRTTELHVHPEIRDAVGDG